LLFAVISRDRKAASISSSRRIVFLGISATLAYWRTVSVITASERFNMEMPRLRCPDKPKIKLVFPQPGGP